MLHPPPDACPAIICLSKSPGLGVFLGTEPAIRLRQCWITAASLQVIDAHIPGHAGAHGKLALDGAARRHGGIVGEQHPAYLAILVGSARSAQQGAVLSPVAEFLRRGKAAFPEPAATVLRTRFVLLEAAFFGGFQIRCKALADQELVQTDGFTFDGAEADM